MPGNRAGFPPLANSHRLCQSFPAKGNRIPDAWFAALAVEPGCEWITADRAYEKFPGVHWRHPLTVNASRKLCSQSCASYIRISLNRDRDEKWCFSLPKGNEIQAENLGLRMGIIPGGDVEVLWRVIRIIWVL